MPTENESGFEASIDRQDLSGWFATRLTHQEVWPNGPTLHEAKPIYFPSDHNECIAERPAIWWIEVCAMVGRQESPDSGRRRLKTTDASRKAGGR
jgi:hypothetical protein